MARALVKQAAGRSPLQSGTPIGSRERKAEGQIPFFIEEVYTGSAFILRSAMFHRTSLKTLF
jgi:hypothetical protein